MRSGPLGSYMCTLAILVFPTALPRYLSGPQTDLPPFSVPIIM